MIAKHAEIVSVAIIVRCVVIAFSVMIVFIAVCVTMMMTAIIA